MPSPITDNNGEIKAVKLFIGEGFGLETPDEFEAKKPFAIRVSDEIDYCISFWMEQSTILPSIELSVTGYNCEFTQEKLTKNIQDLQPEKYFVRPSDRLMSTLNRYQHVRYILYSKHQAMNRYQPLTSMAAGRNLIMDDGTVNIFINLKCIAPSTPQRGGLPDIPNPIKIWNFKVRPLRTPFSTGFLNANNMIEIWRKNNKSRISNDDIDNMAKNYLLPYNSIPAVINL